MVLFHTLLVLIANGFVAMGAFALRELAPIIGVGIGVVFARFEIKDDVERNKGITHDELFA